MIPALVTDQPVGHVQGMTVRTASISLQDRFHSLSIHKLDFLCFASGGLFALSSIRRIEFDSIGIPRAGLFLDPAGVSDNPRGQLVLSVAGQVNSNPCANV